MTKYTLPPARPRAVVRTRLLAALRTGLTLIAAPAGFGKSTLAAELARTSGRQVAWLSLDAGDNDPVRFGAYVAAAFGQPALPLDSLIPALINAVASDSRQWLLVLDDYHVIEATEIHDAVALLLDRLPPSLSVLIATRRRPPLPLARLRVRGELTEIPAANLRFTADEAAAFLRGTMGLTLPADGMDALVGRTEGWVAGLQLAALSLHGAADWSDFTGHHPDLLEYLLSEVLHHQPAAVQAFLLRTAILNRLTGPLCDAVTGGTDGRRVLSELEQANLFLFPLDAERRWYRYHSLFAEFLLARLRDAVGEAGVAALHRQAASWFHGAGQAADAIDHLLAAGEWDLAADWMETALAESTAAGASRTLERWVAQLPAAVFGGHPRLATMAAWSLIAHGDVAQESQFNRAQGYLDLAGRTLGRAGGELAGVLAAVRTALAPWAPLRQCPMCTLQDLAHAADCADEALTELPPESFFWRSVVKSSLGAAFLRAGDATGASEEFGAAARLGARSGDLAAAVVALQRHAELLVALGRLKAADGAAREALQLAAELGGEALPALAPIYLIMGRLAYERNDLDGAAHSLTEALRRYDAGGHAAPGALLALARVQQARGEGDAAHDLALQAGDLLGAGPRLRAAGAAAWPDGANVLLARGDVAGARRWAQLGGAGLEGPPDLWRSAEYLALARVLIAEEQPDAALTLLRPLRHAARAGGCRAVEAEALVAEVLAYSKLGDGPAARGALESALALTAAEGFVRLYADGGRPIIALLRQLRQGDGAQRAYVERLLTILGGESPAPGPALVEPLTEREQEILKLLAVGHSNQSVAQELFMGVSTVKWHLINIYGKLQVRSRTQAVARARELGLV